MKIAKLVLLAVLCGGSTAQAADRREMNPFECRDVDAKTALLVTDEFVRWLKFPHFVQICPLYRPELVWYLLVLRFEFMDEYTDEQIGWYDPRRLDNPPYPLPAILAPDGTRIGTLTDGYPSKGNPTIKIGMTHVYVSDWHGNFPYHIDVHVDNAAVVGSYDAPSLRWNEKTHHYDQIGTGIRNQVQ